MKEEESQRGGPSGWDDPEPRAEQVPTQELLSFGPPAQRRPQEVRGHIGLVSSSTIAGDGELEELVTAPPLR